MRTAMSLSEDSAPAGLFGPELIMGGDNVPVELLRLRNLH